MKRNLKVKLTLLLAVSLISIFVLSGCGKSYDATLRVYNWGDYIDKSVITDFEKEYNIKVIYSTFTTNEDMYVSLKSGGNAYDVVFIRVYG